MHLLPPASMAALVVMILGLFAGSGNALTNAAREKSEMMETLYINSELVDCEGVGPQKCMQMRRAPDEEWELFYNQIEGFTFEPGFTYELRVRVTPAADVPADASSLQYKLVEVVAKTPV